VNTSFEPDQVRALTFDVFGTVVDWRGSIIREAQAFGARNGVTADWVAFTDQWRGMYQPSMHAVRSGKRPWTKLDDLHRESLETLCERFGFAGKVSERDLDDLTRAWHRLAPWPDVVPGLERLRRRYVLVTLSNGNVSLLVNLSRFAGLRWDAVLGAEPTRHYKPVSEAYLGTARFLDLQPPQCLMVAAHNDDLISAASLGFRTAFVARPTEYGPHQQTDLRPAADFDIVTDSFQRLAEQLGV